MREAKDDKWDAIVKACGNPDAATFDDAARGHLSQEMEAELKQKQNARFPYVIVPGALRGINVNDKDGNGVYRIVVYKE